MLPNDPAAELGLLKARRLRGRYEFQGLKISVESRKGDYRHWRDRNGEEGKTLMAYDYGYIRGTHGADREHLDCYIGPNKSSTTVYVVNQRRVTDWRRFDEHKVMLGFDSEAAAKKAYLQHYSEAKFFGSITAMPMPRFKRWISSGKLDAPVHKAVSMLEDSIKLGFAEAVQKALRPPGSGWQLIPRGRKGGFRRRKGDGWEYWYAESGGAGTKHGTLEWSEEDYAAGKFDKDPSHWRYFQIQPGEPPIGWRDGGVDPDSAHPVKEAGAPHRLYRIKKAEQAAGWALLEDIHSGETRVVQHARIYPVFYEKPGKRPVSEPAPEKPSGGAKPVVQGPGNWEKRIPAYANSAAEQGTALHAMENGAFARTAVRVYERDASGNAVFVRRIQTVVDDRTMGRLVEEFSPLLQSAAKTAVRKFKLSPSAEEDMRAYAAEGLIRAAHAYPGGFSFAAHAKAFIGNFVNVYAAKESFGAQSVSDREMRLVTKYIAAKGQAARKLGIDSPSPVDVCHYWKIKKRDIHPFEKTDPQRNEDVPLGAYRLKIKRSEGGKTITEAEGTTQVPGKLALARRMHDLVEGNKASVSLSDLEAVLPGPNVGLGLSPEEVVTVQSSLAKVLPTMKAYEVTLGEKKRSYQVDGEKLVSGVLGLDGDDPSSWKLASTLAVKVKRADGSWEAVSKQHAHELMPKLLDSALSHVARELGIDRGGLLVTRAKAKLLPKTEVKPGPSFGQWLEARSRSVVKEDIQAWRSKERDRFRRVRDRLQDSLRALPAGNRDIEMDLHSAKQSLRELDAISNREIAKRIVMSRALESTPEIRKMMTSTVSVEAPSKGVDLGWKVATITNEQNGKQRRVWIRTYSVKKSDAETVPSHWLLDTAAKHPNLFRLRFSTGKLAEL